MAYNNIRYTKAPMWVRMYTHLMIFVYAIILTQDRASEKTRELTKWMLSKIGMTVEGQKFTVVVHGLQGLCQKNMQTNL